MIYDKVKDLLVTMRDECNQALAAEKGTDKVGIGGDYLIRDIKAEEMHILQKEQNMKEYNTDINEIRKREYPQLEANIYLDNAGMPPCAKSVMERCCSVMLQSLYANPHSQSQVSMDTESLISQTRAQVLDMFELNHMDYEVVFTQNATQAIKTVGQGFRDTFGENFNYVWNIDSHTSMVGIREYSGEDINFTVPTEDMLSKFTCVERATLVSWSGQSNFNGRRYPISDWNKLIKAQHDEVVTFLDMSSLCSTSPPKFGDMESIPDFMCLSFYKIFGYPDLGCLLVNKNAAKKVFAGKKYYGGGTVDAIAPDGYVERKLNFSGLLEEGSLPIHNIIQLSAAASAFLDIYGSFDNVSKHVTSLTRYAFSSLRKLQHLDTSVSMVDFLGCSAHEVQGPVLAFCLNDRNGKRSGFYDFERFAAARHISLRTGAMCNTGATSVALGLAPSDIRQGYAKGQKCGDGADTINGKVRGVVRISFGAMNSFEDIDTFCECIEEFFSKNFLTGVSNIQHTDVTLRSIVAYPIKSCNGFSIPAGQSWKVVAGGLQYDRIFCILDPVSKSPLLLKHNPMMTAIKPVLDPVNKIMTIKHGGKQITVSLNEDISSLHRTKVITNDRNGVSYECIVDPVIMSFMKDVLKVPCVLARQVRSDTKAMHNKSDFLLLSRASLKYLDAYDHDSSDGVKRDTSSRFRGNLLVDGPDLKPFEEDSWKFLSIGGLVVKNVELCERCAMITIDSDTGKRDNKQMTNLSKFRKLNGKILFGVNCDIDPSCDLLHEDITIKAGDRLVITK